MNEPRTGPEALARIASMMARPGFILMDGGGKVPDWPSMPRAAAHKRAKGGESTPWPEYAAGGKLATVEEAVEHIRRGRRIAIPCGCVPAVVIDCDSGDWRAVVRRHAPAAHARSSKPGRRHLWYHHSTRDRLKGQWKACGASGDVRGRGHYVVVWHYRETCEAITALADADETVAAPAFARKPPRLSPPPPPVRLAPLPDERRGREAYLHRVLGTALDAIRTASRGCQASGRHPTLLARTRALAGLHASSGVPGFADRAKAALIAQFLEHPDKGRREAEATVDIAWRDGAANPIEPQGGWR